LGPSRISPNAHDLLLPWRSLDLDRQPLGARREQEVTPMSRLQERSLPRAQGERLLQLGRFTRTLSTEKDQGGIGGDDPALV
jgi:hypothetical protein